MRPECRLAIGEDAARQLKEMLGLLVGGVNSLTTLSFTMKRFKELLENMKPIRSSDFVKRIMPSLLRIKYVTKKGDGQRVECIFTHFIAKKGHPVKQGTGLLQLI